MRAIRAHAETTQTWKDEAQVHGEGLGDGERVLCSMLPPHSKPWQIHECDIVRYAKLHFQARGAVANQAVNQARVGASGGCCIPAHDLHDGVVPAVPKQLQFRLQCASHI